MFIITRKVREMENADYLTTHKDYSESVDALERAIATLKKQAYDRTQLLQVSQLNLIPEHAKKVRQVLVVKSYKTRRERSFEVRQRIRQRATR